jgi:GTP-binding protein
VRIKQQWSPAALFWCIWPEDTNPVGIFFEKDQDRYQRLGQGMSLLFPVVLGDRCSCLGHNRARSKASTKPPRCQALKRVLSTKEEPIVPNLNVRNVAIIAHVDHGKTTLVDCLLQQTGLLDASAAERAMDSNDLEKERGITILAKNTAINYRDTQINIVDTPGHADFGGEVERILSMVDAVLLLVDAVDGPMPQTRFVTQKAFAYGLKPIVVVNKIDRPGADPDRAIDQVFELFDNLGGTDEQLDFSSVYASAINGVAGLELDAIADDMSPLLDMIVDQVPPPEVDENGAFQMQISSLDYSTYEGVIGIGRISRGVGGA